MQDVRCRVKEHLVRLGLLKMSCGNVKKGEAPAVLGLALEIDDARG